MNNLRIEFRLNRVIILLLLLILLIAITIYNINIKENYINYPEQVDPSNSIKSDPDAIAANNNYASILLYLQKNPSKSIKFIEDLKYKFFDKECNVKSDIDFNKLAQTRGGMIF